MASTTTQSASPPSRPASCDANDCAAAAGGDHYSARLRTPMRDRRVPVAADMDVVGNRRG
jgi:hypothetical protein